MSSEILMLGGVFFLLFSWFLYHKSIELFACLIIAVNFDFFYLAPLIGKFPIYRLVAVALVIFLILIRVLQGDLSLGRYGAWFLLIVPITIIGIIQAYFSGQDLVLGLKASKFIPLLLAYFLFVGKDFNTEKFALYFAAMALGIALIVLLEQHTMSGGMNFFIGLNKELRGSQITARLGKVRIVIGSFVIAAGGIMAFARFIRNKHRVLSLFVAGLLLLHTVFMTQIRMLIFAMLITMALLAMITRRFSPFMIMGLLFIALLIVPAWGVISSEIVQKSELASLTAKEFNKKSGSIGARAATYEYYWNAIQKNSFLGTGMLNFDWDGNPERRLQQNGLHLSDIGIMHFFFATGIIGFLWFVPGLLLMWADILRCRHCSIAAGYIIMATIAIPTLDLFLRADTMLVFGVFSALLSNALSSSPEQMIPEVA